MKVFIYAIKSVMVKGNMCYVKKPKGNSSTHENWLHSCRVTIKVTR